MRVPRRKFLKGCLGGLFALNQSRVSNLVFGQTPSINGDTVISVFLRGGMDALSFFPPYNDANYHIGRDVLGLGPGQVIDVNGQFGFHPAAGPLKTLYDNNDLAVIVASGSPNASRSHFEAQDLMERGNPDDQYYSGGGWLARHLAHYSTGAIFEGVSSGSTVAVALEGFSGALALGDAASYTLSGSGSQEDDLRRALRAMYGADPGLSAVAARTLDATDIIDFASPGTYVPGNGVTYPNSDFARAMASVAQMMRLDIGLRAATVDMGGWDTHESQASGSNPTTGTFASLAQQLSEGLYAFWSDLQEYHGQVTVVVMTEFGRRLKENDNRGTDHGHGGLMMVLSSDVIGGVYGAWPGLGYDELFQHVDLAVTSDFRTVLSEVLIARAGHGQASLPLIFPGYDFQNPLGFFGLVNAVPPKTWKVYP